MPASENSRHSCAFGVGKHGGSASLTVEIATAEHEYRKRLVWPRKPVPTCFER